MNYHNIVDLCPVGHLRRNLILLLLVPGNLRRGYIDVMDAVGSNIRIDSRGPEVVRILPRCNEEINEEWISDKTRHACDGLKRQRLDTPMIKDIENNLFLVVGNCFQKYTRQFER